MSMVIWIPLAALCILRVSECLECFSCQNIADPAACRNTSQCSSGQSCFLQTFQAGPDLHYNMGCQNNQLCSTLAVGPNSIIGRSMQTRQTYTCHECCSADRCNQNLCFHKKPSECTDDGALDCARLNTLFNVCADVQHAKITCPKFCGLCQIVDGNWAEWATWTPCSVTCEDGKQARTRTCTNPQPSNGGLDCSGPAFDTKLCTKQLCPVHGNWTDWSTWSGCSVTCHVGLIKRTRTCTNPRPDRFGDNCYGDASEYAVCQNDHCVAPVQGNWSAWSVWSTCSVTCDGGLQKRSRSCSNPKPNAFGDYCVGDNSEYTVCQSQPCVFPVHGNWSAWSLWSTCSVTCDGGLQKRSRTCTNPKPNALGDYCVGDNNEYTSCLNDPCGDRNGGWSSWGSWQSCSVTCGVGHKLRDRTCTNPSPTLYGKACEGNSEAFAVCVNTPCNVIAFNAHGLHVLSNRVSAFQTVIFNEGNAYSADTGHFTAPVNGIYYFTANICYQPQQGIAFFIEKANASVSSSMHLTASYDYHAASVACLSASTSVKLNRDEHVWVLMDSQYTSANIYEGFDGFNTFTGTLIQEL